MITFKRWLSDDKTRRKCPSCGGSDIMNLTVRTEKEADLTGLTCRDCGRKEVM